MLLLFSGITENKKSANEHSSQTTNNVKESLENLKKLGLGDIEFMACIGLCIGFGHSLLALIAGCLLGAVIQGGIQLYRKKSGRFPTTPYLAMGVYLVLLWGDTVLNWYVRTFVY